MIRFAPALAGLALLAAGPAAAQQPVAVNRIDLVRPDAPALAAPGPFPVGVFTHEAVNPGQVDILNVKPGEPLPRYDRKLTMEIWHPAAEGTAPGTDYRVILRDGVAEATIHGRASRGAAPAAGGPFPVVVISHGYPGNRFLLSHLGEALAGRGYVAVSLDHLESTYENRAAFGSTLVNRPLDQKYALDEIARLAAPGGPLAGVADPSNAAVVGYSMGGYGALIYAGAGVTQAGVDLSWGAPAGTLGVHLAGSETHEALMDDRLKAVIAIGPWGWTRGFWDAATAAGLRKPTLFVAGSADDVSGYAPGVRSIWEAGKGADRWLLTFEHAGHNAAAPMPAPAESWAPSEHIPFVPFAHYADPVWDTVRMNNILQHFAAAFLDWQLKGDAEAATYLDLVPNAADGVWAVNEDGTRKPEHSYWTGFGEGTARGLRMEKLSAGQ